MQKSIKLNHLIIICLIIVCYTVTTLKAVEIVSRRKSSNICYENTECPQNSYCERHSPSTNGYCSCIDGYFLHTQNRTRDCIKIATSIGNFCDYDEQCQLTLSNEAECRLNSCQCRYGSHYVASQNACYRTSLIGEYCRLTYNCIGDTFCRDGICVCPIGTHQNLDNRICLEDIQLGQLCYKDEECVAENARCHNVCRCKSTHAISLDTKRCLPIASKLQDPCEEDEQCTRNLEFSACHRPAADTNGTCKCSEFYHEIDSECFTTVFLNGICEVNENCAIVENTICIGGRCRCQNYYIQEDGRCNVATNLKSCLFTSVVFLVFKLIM